MGLKNNINVGVSGHFKIEKTGADGEVLETYEFDNLVLDSGLKPLVQDSIIRIAENCYVGTGNSFPAKTQTTLDSVLASRGKSAVDKLGAYEGCQRAYKYTYKFPSSAVSGNITEIGTGRVPNNLFNRQLIRDAEGNPTSITVLEQEDLNVYFIIKLYYNSIFTQQPSFILNGTTYTLYSKAVLSDEWFYLIKTLRNGQNKDIANAHTVSLGEGTKIHSFTIGSGEGSHNVLSSSNIWRLRGDGVASYIEFYTEPELVKDKFHTLNMDITFKFGRYGE